MRAFLPFLLLAACDSGSQSGQAGNTPAPPLPPQLCEQARKALESLGAKGVIEYDDRGQATVPQEIWLQMGGGEQRNQFARMLAFHAACAKPDGSRERPVLIRNEYGAVLLENVVPTDIDLGALPGE